MIPGRWKGTAANPLAALTAVAFWAFTIGEAVAIENLRPAATGVWVGGAPVGQADWAELARLGVRTAVGVDGLAPDRDAAAVHAIRVVHVPLGYDGVDQLAAAMLTRVARDPERPLYVYCHHGRHRGPAAAAIVGRAAGLLDIEGATRLLIAAGTSPSYPGLWRDVAEFVPPTADAELPELVERVNASPLAIAMAQLDRAWDEATRDKSDGSRANLVAASEAMAESVRAALAEGRDPELVAAIREADRALHGLPDPASGARHAAFTSIDTACAACHRRWRDGG